MTLPSIRARVLGFTDATPIKYRDVKLYLQDKGIKDPSKEQVKSAIKLQEKQAKEMAKARERSVLSGAASSRPAV